MAATQTIPIQITPSLFLGKKNLGAVSDGYLKTVIERGQNLYDMAIQCYGSAESILAILAHNPSIINLNTLPLPASSINYLAISEQNKAQLKADFAQANYFQLNKIRIKTG